MSNKILPNISPFQLTLGFIPIIVVLIFFYLWTDNTKRILYALFRMVVQLLLVGYVLKYIFQTDSPLIVVMVLAFMLAIASWIALGPIRKRGKIPYYIIFPAMLLGGGFTLAFVTQIVIGIHPWYLPRYIIPLAGMVFANAMNSVSLSAERLLAELDKGENFTTARASAFKASLIPITNSLFAVGLVSLPGLMTGQILSGVSPLVAVRYQIVIMLMILSSTGISSGLFLTFIKPTLTTNFQSVDKVKIKEVK